MARTVATDEWVSVTLTRNELWSADQRYMASWDGEPIDDLDGIPVPAGLVIQFYNTDVVWVKKISGETTNISRQPRP